jgi:two-component system, LuxR family, sensor kinase FixL
MPEKYATHHDHWVDQYLATGEHTIIGIGREVQGLHKDGSTFPFDLSVGVADTDEGKQFIGVMRDLRARKQIEERLRNLQTELNQMTRINAMDEMGATVAHELNQPLTAIILYMQAIERKIRSASAAEPLNQGELDQLGDLCARAVQEAQRTSRLLQRIRAIIEKDEPERSLCNMVDIIERARELALVGFAATDIDIDFDYEGRLPSVFVDPVQIEQIVLNLLRNAFQAMRNSKQKSIRISMWESAGESDRRPRLTTAFKDSGPGIPDDCRDSLFKAFDANRRNGMGLGLAIARSIAQNHGGSLDLAPFDKDDPGACFLLTLPVVPATSKGKAVPDEP